MIAATSLSPHNLIPFFVPTCVNMIRSTVCCVTRLTSLYVTSKLIHVVCAHRNSCTFLVLFLDSVFIISLVASVCLPLTVLLLGSLVSFPSAENP